MKSCARGPKSLSDIELLAILLGSGTKTHNVLSLADRLLKAMDKLGAKPHIDEPLKINGIGPAKATLIVAALEFARRRIRPEGFRISFPAEVLPLMEQTGSGEQTGSAPDIGHFDR